MKFLNQSKTLLQETIHLCLINILKVIMQFQVQKKTINKLNNNNRHHNKNYKVLLSINKYKQKNSNNSNNNQKVVEIIIRMISSRINKIH